jgi:endonuclease/exonuclease/phosphatase family metal-dependent hydrolase
MRLRVVTLNVWNTEGDARRPELIHHELKRLDPDLVAFQDVVQTCGVKMLNRLLDGLNLHATHQADVQRYIPRYAERYGGTGIASRWPHEAIEALDLRVVGAVDVPWATLAVSVALPDVGEMLFIAATAAWRPAAEAAREQQVIAITDLDARHRRDLPTLIAGDFNATPDAASIRYLTGRQSLKGRSVLYHDAWTVAGEGPGYTWTVDNPHARREPSRLCGNHIIAADSTMFSSAVGRPIPSLAQRSRLPVSPSTGQSRASGLVITLASSWTFRSVSIVQINAGAT